MALAAQVELGRGNNVRDYLCVASHSFHLSLAIFFSPAVALEPGPKSSPVRLLKPARCPDDQILVVGERGDQVRDVGLVVLHGHRQDRPPAQFRLLSLGHAPQAISGHAGQPLGQRLPGCLQAVPVQPGHRRHQRRRINAPLGVAECFEDCRPILVLAGGPQELAGEGAGLAAGYTGQRGANGTRRASCRIAETWGPPV